MKIFGWLCIVFGIGWCMTVIAAPLGIGLMVVGALLLIAAAITKRRAEPHVPTEPRPTKLAEGNVSNSMFGR